MSVRRTCTDIGLFLSSLEYEQKKHYQIKANSGDREGKPAIHGSTTAPQVVVGRSLR
jgi:hypothetical protein